MKQGTKKVRLTKWSSSKI